MGKVKAENGRSYIYTFSCDEKEISLCSLEIRSLFGVDSNSQHTIIETSIELDPSRSPFIKSRIEISAEGKTIEEVKAEIRDQQLSSSAFKVFYIKNQADDQAEEYTFEERRRIEKEIGSEINGSADLHHPDRIFGIMFANGRWIFGACHENEATWLRHKQKPHSYSTSLNTRLARAVINIAVPDPAGIKAIDPCCGIGTVVVEGLSMGIDIVGSDVNPLVLAGARENIAHFGLKGEITRKDIHDVAGHFDTAIVDLPYNLCSVLPEKEKLKMLQSARSFTHKLVVITIEPIDALLQEAGFQIEDRCELKKRTFTRQVIVCK